MVRVKPCGILELVNNNISLPHSTRMLANRFVVKPLLHLGAGRLRSNDKAWHFAVFVALTGIVLGTHFVSHRRLRQTLEIVLVLFDYLVVRTCLSDDQIAAADILAES
jgi:hypothetical protein